jgi:hypothetical protein
MIAAISFDESVASRQDAIRLRAYGYFERRGREHGHDLDDWLAAEAEVVGRSSLTPANQRRGGSTTVK